MRTSAIGFTQIVENVRQQRSRIVQTLDVPQMVRLGPSLAAALLDGPFEQSAYSAEPSVTFYKPMVPEPIWLSAFR
jgi:hypothetical protein